MALSSFCGLLTLEVGATVLAAVFLTLAFVILVANLFDSSSYGETWSISTTLVIIFAIGLIIVGVLAFASSYNNSRPLALASAILILVLFVYWLVLSCFSFFSHQQVIRNICVYKRCPETFWLSNLDYRTNQDLWKSPQNESTDPKNVTKPEVTRRKRSNIEQNKSIRFTLLNSLPEPGEIHTVNTSLTQITVFNKYNLTNSAERPIKLKALYRKNVNNDIIQTDRDLINYQLGRISLETSTMSQETNDTVKQEELSRYKFGGHLISAIIISIVNAIFLLYSAFVMWSWAQELDYTDYIIEEAEYEYAAVH